MAEVKGLKVAIGGAIGDFKSKLGEVSGGLTGLGPVAAASGAAVVAGLAVVGTAAFNVGVEFEKAQATIQSGTGATGEALQGLTEDFRAVFRGVPEDMGTVSGALADLNTRLGASGPALQGVTTQFLNLKRLPQGAGVEINTLTGAVQSFSDELPSVNAGFDKLFIAAQNTNVGVGELSGLIERFGPELKAFGFSFEESAALMGNLSKAGVNSQRVMQGLKSASSKLARQGIDTADGLRQFVTQVERAPGATETATLAAQLFGGQADVMTQAVKSGAFSVGDLVTKMNNSKGAINANAEAALSVGQKWDIFKNKISDLLVPLGGLLVDALTFVVDILNNTLQPAIEGTGTAFTAIKDFLKPFGEAFGGFGEIIGDLAALWVGLADFLAEQFGPLMEDIGNFLGKFFDFLKRTAIRVIDDLRRGWDKFLELLKKVPGVNNLIERGQKRLNTALGDAKTETDNAEAATFDFNTTLKDAKVKQDAVKTSSVNLKSAMKGVKDETSAARFEIHDFSVVVRNTAGELDDLIAKAKETRPALDTMIEAPDINEVKSLATETSNASLKINESLLPAVKDIPEPVTKAETAFSDFKVNVNDDLGTIAGKFKSVFVDPVIGLVNTLINDGLNLLLGSLDGVIGKVGSLGGALKGVFGGGASAASSAAGSAAGTAARVGGRAGTAVATGGLSEIVLGVGQLATSILNLFGGAKREKTLNAIEENTRKTARQLTIPGGVQDMLNQFLPELLGIRKAAWAINGNAVFLGAIKDRVTDIARQGSPTVNVNVELDGEKIARNVESRIEFGAQVALA